jgi:hypothetical protein
MSDAQSHTKIRPFSNFPFPFQAMPRGKEPSVSPVRMYAEPARENSLSVIEGECNTNAFASHT